MALRPFVPKGFRLVAVTEPPGCGGTVVYGYVSADAKKVYIRIKYTVVGDSRADAEEREVSLGPVERRLLGPLMTTLSDIGEMKAFNPLD